MKSFWGYLACFLASLLVLSFIAVPTAQSKRAPRVVPCAIIPTTDGLRLSGHVFGGGQDAVILAHMYPDDQTQWYPFALFLSELGYQVLTFDFRGFGESEGQIDVARNYRDIQAAVTLLKNRGGRNIYLIGASMGGTASLKALTLGPIPEVRAVVILSSPVEFQGLSVRRTMLRVQVPALFLAAEDDGGAAADARWLYENAGGPGQLRLWPGSEHGTELLQGPSGWEIRGAILDFLDQSRPLAAGLSIDGDELDRIFYPSYFDLPTPTAPAN